MAKYTNVVTTQLSEQEINQIVFDTLIRSKFKQKLRDGEQVWQKGGALVAPQFIKVIPQEGRAVVEGWLKFAVLPGVYLGEMDLTGFMGAAIKNALRKTIANLEAALRG